MHSFPALKKYPDLQQALDAELSRTQTCCGGGNAVIRKYLELGRQRDAMTAQLPRQPIAPKLRR